MASFPMVPTIERSPDLSDDEWTEVQALRKAITEAPSTVVPWRMERFAELFTRSLLGKGDLPLI
jgi:hypothetical protein